MENRLTFEEFIRDWRTLKVVALGNIGVSPEDRDRPAEKSANQLTELAVIYGFREQSNEAARPYRGVNEYVKALYDTAEHQAK